MTRWLLYAGFGLLCLGAGYTLGALKGGGDLGPAGVLGAGLRNGVLAGILWAILRRAGRRTLATVLAFTGSGILAIHLGYALALAL